MKETAARMEQEYLRVKGFNFDSLVIVNKQQEMKKDLVPDVFKNGVQHSFSELLERVIVLQSIDNMPKASPSAFDQMRLSAPPSMGVSS